MNKQAHRLTAPLQGDNWRNQLRDFLAQDDASRMSHILNDLEALALADKVTACCLMPYLWEIASGVLGAHDVTDALDLWLADVRDPRITLHVRYLAEHGEDEDVRNHFQRVIANAHE